MKTHVNRNFKKAWSKKDEELLLDMFGDKPMQYLVRRLGRSAFAIQQKHKELTGTYDIIEASGLLSASMIANILSVSPRTISNWIRDRDFPAEQRLRLNDQSPNNMYTSYPEEVWKWIEQNKQRVNFALIEQGKMLPEPDWLEEEIKNAKMNFLKQPKNWTEKEDEIAYSMWTSGENYRDIARLLNRSETGTQRRLTLLKKRSLQKAN